MIRSQVVFPTFTCRRKKDHSSRRFLLILGMGALLSAVSAGVAVSAVILYHLGIIFGVFLPCKPVKKSFGTAVESCSKKVMLSAASANTTIPAGRFGFSGFQ